MHTWSINTCMATTKIVAMHVTIHALILHVCMLETHLMKAQLELKCCVFLREIYETAINYCST